MIRSFKSKALRLFAQTGDARKLSVPNAPRVRRILNELDVAKTPDDMNLPGYRFHALKGSRNGTFAVDASVTYRVTFRWVGGHAFDVDLEDYH